MNYYRGSDLLSVVFLVPQGIGGRGHSPAHPGSKGPREPVAGRRDRSLIFHSLVFLGNGRNTVRVSQMCLGANVPSGLGKGAPLVRCLCTTWESVHKFFTEMCPSGGTKYLFFEFFLSILRAPVEGRGGAPGTVPLHNLRGHLTEGMFEKCWYCLESTARKTRPY